MKTFNLTLTPENPCDWQKISTLLQRWNGSTRRQPNRSKDEALFSTLLPTTDQERFTSLLKLQNILAPHSISFSLEIIP